MKGSWIDATTFAVNAQFIGQGEERQWRLTFAGDRLTFKTRGRYGKEVTIEGNVVQ